MSSSNVRPSPNATVLSNSSKGSKLAEMPESVDWSNEIPAAMLDGCCCLFAGGAVVLLSVWADINQDDMKGG